MMMAGLALVAGTAMGQVVPGQNNYPYKGGKYSYTLDGIGLVSAGNATISGGGTGWTFSNVNGVGASTEYTLGTNIAYNLGADQTLTFDIEFADDAGVGTITVTVSDGGGCPNFIEFLITPQDKPTIELAISVDITDDPMCQAKNSTPLTDNTDAVTDDGPHENTIIFTVTPVVDNVADGTDFQYSYDISIDDLAAVFDVSGGVYSISPAVGSISRTANNSSLSVDTYTITFATKAGIVAQSVDGTISSGSLTVTTTSGSVNGDVTYGITTETVNIGSTPAIGNFTIE